MKLFSALTVLLASVAAFATPAVGDLAKFNVKIEQNGAYMLGTYEASILGRDSAGLYKFKTVVAMEDQQAQSQEQMIEAKDLLSDETIQGALTNCAAYGGVNSTYMMGTQAIPTCVIPLQDDAGHATGEVHLALVALGIAKQVQLDASTGRTVTLELTSFVNGK